VGTKENVLRVKKDEAEARAREEEKAKRALLAVGFVERTSTSIRNVIYLTLINAHQL